MRPVTPIRAQGATARVPAPVWSGLSPHDRATRGSAVLPAAVVVPRPGGAAALRLQCRLQDRTIHPLTGGAA